MRHYITGAGGFIGQHVVKRLQDEGHEVILVKRPITAFKLSMEENFVLIHLAGYGNHHHHSGVDSMIQANILDLDYLLRYGINSKCVKFYNVSTSAIQLPTKTLYSATKLVGELMVEAWKIDRFVNVRPFSVYGPGEADHRFIPTVIRALHSGEIVQLDPYAVHDWIYVADFIDAMFKGYTRIGHGMEWTNLEVVKELEAISGKLLNYQVTKLRSYDTKSWSSDQPVPGRSFTEGLIKTYEYFIKQGAGDKQKAWS